MRIKLAMVAALVAAGAASSAEAQSNFYAGKQVNVIVGYTTGGGYDVVARLLARYMPDYIPGKPSFVVQNMPGAGSIKAMNFIYAAAPKDGLTFGTIGRGIPVDPLLGNKEAQFDAAKMNWIGSTSAETSVCAAWHTAKIKSWDDMQKTEFTAAGEGPASDADIFSAALKNSFGAKIRLVTGYPGGAEMALAIEREEVEGRCGWSWSSIKSTRPTWVPEKKLIPFLTLSLRKNPELPDVPVVTEFAKTDEQMQLLKLFLSRQEMGRPYVAPPGVPSDRIAILTKAFDETMKDEKFVAEMVKNKLEVSPMSGKEVAAMLNEIYAMPKDVTDKAREIVEKGAR
ncbi:MAG TPA: tripartite tricarboxylate transporter substrate-binding protein [Alphaproteobacteria bacterium]|nr:tripartite tricarboxylate transporter substrate-binding protein [Alphaproteobacteria bacterium]